MKTEIALFSTDRPLPLPSLGAALVSAAVFSGELLLYVCFAVPYVVDQKLAILSLDEPAQASNWGTVWPYYSVLHLLALGVGIGLLLLARHRTRCTNYSFLAYIAVNIFGIATLFLFTPSGTTNYLDFVIEFLRFFSVMVLATGVVVARDFDPRILVRGFLILFTIPLVFLVALNPTGFLLAREGRVNGPGLEMTSTGHVAALGVLLGIALPLRRGLRIVLIGCGVLVLLLSGARIPFMLAVVMVLAQVWHGAKNRRERYRLVLITLGFTAVALFAATSSVIGGGHTGTLTGDRASMQTEYAVGRGLAVLISTQVISEHPWGFADSDWSIQEELVRHGWPSHTHSNYFQSYLRYGPLVLVFWGVLIARARQGWKLHSPYAGCLWFAILGSAFDYYGCITKAMLLLFMIAQLNEAFIYRARRGLASPDLVG